MPKRLIMLIALSFLFLLSGCEQKPLYPKKKKSSAKPEKIKAKTKSSTTPKKATVKRSDTKKKKSDVGIADAADYATGYTPLKTKSFSKTRLNNSYNDRQKNVDKALEDK